MTHHHQFQFVTLFALFIVSYYFYPCVPGLNHHHSSILKFKSPVSVYVLQVHVVQSSTATVSSVSCILPTAPPLYLTTIVTPLQLHKHPLIYNYSI